MTITRTLPAVMAAAAMAFAGCGGGHPGHTPPTAEELAVDLATRGRPGNAREAAEYDTALANGLKRIGVRPDLVGAAAADKAADKAGEKANERQLDVNERETELEAAEKEVVDAQQALAAAEQARDTASAAYRTPKTA